MRKKLVFGTLVGLAAALLALALKELAAFDRAEKVTWDWRVRFFAHPSRSSERIKIIVLDEPSITWAKETLGLSWPWPREVYGPLLDFCKRGGARVVAFDVFFPDASRHGVEQDVALGDAIRRGPPFVGAALLAERGGAATEWPADLSLPGPLFDDLRAALSGAPGGPLTAKTATFSIPEVRTNVTMLGDVAGTPDEDGVIRRAHLLRVFDGEPVASLGLASYLIAREAEGKSSAPRLEAGAMQIGGRRVPMDEETAVILRFRGAPGTYQWLSVAEVIQSELRIQEGGQPKLNPGIFRDACVLLGFTAHGLMDLRPTPMSPVSPGVEVHATLLDNLLEGDAIGLSPAWLNMASTLLIGLLCGVVILQCRRPWQTVTTLFAFLALPAGVAAVAYQQGLWWPWVTVESAVALALTSGVVLNYATEGRQKAFIKRAFKHYLSAAVIERILEDPSQLQLGGERRELTLFFSDLEKFSSFSERLNPQDLTALLNDYLTDMTNIIQDEGGTVDKYIGDAIVAFWNAPLEQADHARRACRAALRCQQRLAERRPEFKQNLDVDLHMRIGVNTGEVVVGNMGSHERFNYTVLGDAANLASRLEGANKAFGTYTMAAQSTWEKTGGAIPGRELGRLRVVGRKAPVTVFELLAGTGDAEASDPFARALALCYDGKLSQAAEIFETLAGDPAARKYAERCRQVLSEKDAGWDGVWNLTEK